MNPVLTERKDELAQLCRRFGVEQLDVFGSASRDDFRPDSDFDFVARFSDTGKGYADRFLDFAEELEKLLGRPVDLVTEKGPPKSALMAAIARDRKTLYAAK